MNGKYDFYVGCAVESESLSYFTSSDTIICFSTLPLHQAPACNIYLALHTDSSLLWNCFGCYESVFVPISTDETLCHWYFSQMR